MITFPSRFFRFTPFVSPFRLLFRPQRRDFYHYPAYSRYIMMGATKHGLEALQNQKNKKHKAKLPLEGSGEDVLFSEVISLLYRQASGKEKEPGLGPTAAIALPFERFHEV